MLISNNILSDSLFFSVFMKKKETDYFRMVSKEKQLCLF